MAVSRDNPEVEKNKKQADHCEVDYDKVDDRAIMDEKTTKHIEMLEAQLMERTAELATATEVLARETEERRRLEKVLQERDEMERLFFSLSREIMFTWDNEFRILSVSPNVEAILGYRPEEFIGRRFDEINVMDPSDLLEAVENAQLLLSKKKLYSSIFRFIAKDGTVKFGELNEALVMKDEKIVKIITVAREVAGGKNEGP